MSMKVIRVISIMAQKGVKVCKEWHEFQNFFDWAILNGYSEKLTLDRIDSKGNYEPSNCKWSTMKEQQNNKANNHKISFNGETKTISQWAEDLGIKTQTLFSRIKRHWSVERALTTEVRGQR